MSLPTRRGVDKLAVYRRLGIREVWFWQNTQFEVHHLRGEDYEKISKSELLPGLDLAMLAHYVVHPDPLEAVLEYREKIRQGLQ